MLCPELGSPLQDRHGPTQVSPAQGHKGDVGAEAPYIERKGCDWSGQPGEEKAQGGLINLYKYLKGEHKEN